MKENSLSIRFHHYHRWLVFESNSNGVIASFGSLKDAENYFEEFNEKVEVNVNQH